jgi:hypothetical protein
MNDCANKLINWRQPIQWQNHEYIHANFGSEKRLSRVTSALVINVVRFRKTENASIDSRPHFRC